MKNPSPILSIVLVPLLAVWPVMAQPAADSIETLLVHAVAGDGSASPSGSHSNQAFTVHVTDQNGSPVADAAVLLRLPDSGATGTFGDGTHAAVGYSDPNGQAHFSGIQWNAEQGTVPLTITATKGAAHAGTLLQQVLTTDIAPITPAPPVHLSAPAPVQSTVAPPVAQPKATSREKTEVAVSQPHAAPPVAPAAATTSSPQPGVVAHAQAALPDASPETPSVSVVNAATQEKFASPGGSSHKNWYILAAIIAGGAGAGVALMGKKSDSSSSSTTGPTISIGSPTVSVGHP